ncbi:nitroreductase family deazaflavin-dependent oxidoreductase [Actinomadura parmotrematis]|uniref:Nitroreductase family deazaflavin-dependent oxidoreductase n=1 Tax=Actinomadura parmotrematis TaxID=2864039 RepID=A0ABS7FS30_9ACTN|nr:nitroreductase family deazaflavin-dependent oxidoreductase [Actinomadura parmotrematis]MBW8482529.1 nitroreductase family deazaflavin-dependent oxidoreductase [Actinomadura parmotrematis]
MPNPAQRAMAPLIQRMAGSVWFSKVGPKIVPRLDKVISKATGGRVLMSQGMVPSLLLTTTGAKSGQPREAPLACVPEPDGTWLVVGSNFGREKHPAWTGNLLKTPAATVTFKGRRTPVTAHLLEGDEREQVWPTLLKVWPVYDQYAARVDRNLRVFRLTPTAAEKAAG